MPNISVTPGMVKYLSNEGHKVRYICSNCSLHIPVYPGRYPQNCPSCGASLLSVQEEDFIEYFNLLYEEFISQKWINTQLRECTVKNVIADIVLYNSYPYINYVNETEYYRDLFVANFPSYRELPENVLALVEALYTKESYSNLIPKFFSLYPSVLISESEAKQLVDDLKLLQKHTPHWLITHTNTPREKQILSELYLFSRKYLLHEEAVNYATTLLEYVGMNQLPPSSVQIQRMQGDSRKIVQGFRFNTKKDIQKRITPVQKRILSRRNSGSLSHRLVSAKQMLQRRAALDKAKAWHKSNPQAPRLHKALGTLIHRSAGTYKPTNEGYQQLKHIQTVENVPRLFTDGMPYFQGEVLPFIMEKKLLLDSAITVGTFFTLKTPIISTVQFKEGRQVQLPANTQIKVTRITPAESWKGEYPNPPMGQFVFEIEVLDGENKGELIQFDGADLSLNLGLNEGIHFCSSINKELSGCVYIQKKENKISEVVISAFDSFLTEQQIAAIVRNLHNTFTKDRQIQVYNDIFDLPLLKEELEIAALIKGKKVETIQKNYLILENRGNKNIEESLLITLGAVFLLIPNLYMLYVKVKERWKNRTFWTHDFNELGLGFLTELEGLDKKTIDSWQSSNVEKTVELFKDFFSQGNIVYTNYIRNPENIVHLNELEVLKQAKEVINTKFITDNELQDKISRLQEINDKQKVPLFTLYYLNLFEKLLILETSVKKADIEIKNNIEKSKIFLDKFTVVLIKKIEYLNSTLFKSDFDYQDKDAKKNAVEILRLIKLFDAAIGGNLSENFFIIVKNLYDYLLFVAEIDIHEEIEQCRELLNNILINREDLIKTNNDRISVIDKINNTTKVLDKEITRKIEVTSSFNAFLETLKNISILIEKEWYYEWQNILAKPVKNLEISSSVLLSFLSFVSEQAKINNIPINSSVLGIFYYYQTQPGIFSLLFETGTLSFKFICASIVFTLKKFQEINKKTEIKKEDLVKIWEFISSDFAVTKSHFIAAKDWVVSQQFLKKAAIQEQSVIAKKASFIKKAGIYLKKLKASLTTPETFISSFAIIEVGVQYLPAFKSKWQVVMLKTGDKFIVLSLLDQNPFTNEPEKFAKIEITTHASYLGNAYASLNDIFITALESNTFLKIEQVISNKKQITDVQIKEQILKLPPNNFIKTLPLTAQIASKKTIVLQTGDKFRIVNEAGELLFGETVETPVYKIDVDSKAWIGTGYALGLDILEAVGIPIEESIENKIDSNSLLTIHQQFLGM